MISTTGRRRHCSSCSRVGCRSPTKAPPPQQCPPRRMRRAINTTDPPCQKAADPLAGKRILLDGLFWPVAGLLLAIAAIILTAKNISLGSPIMAGDEYAYFALSREFP